MLLMTVNNLSRSSREGSKSMETRTMITFHLLMARRKRSRKKMDMLQVYNNLNHSHNLNPIHKLQYNNNQLPQLSKYLYNCKLVNTGLLASTLREQSKSRSPSQCGLKKEESSQLNQQINRNSVSMVSFKMENWLWNNNTKVLNNLKQSSMECSKAIQ